MGLTQQKSMVSQFWSPESEIDGHLPLWHFCVSVSTFPLLGAQSYCTGPAPVTSSPSTASVKTLPPNKITSRGPGD